MTAKDRFEYWTGRGRLNAIGQAHAVRGEDTIDADTMSAIFMQGPQKGGKELSRLEADGHVVIVTPAETLTADHGVYKKDTNVAALTGHVTIKRGPNILEGDSADLDMNTNISRMHAGSGPNARVRGVFYPGSQNGLTEVGKPKAEAIPTVPVEPERTDAALP